MWPWADPAIAASAQGCDITLQWLTNADNTLSLCAPLGDQTRIGIVFAVILHDLITEAFDRYNRAGKPLHPKLLVLLDEAANTPLPKPPSWRRDASASEEGRCIRPLQEGLTPSAALLRSTIPVRRWCISRTGTGYRRGVFSRQSRFEAWAAKDQVRIERQMAKRRARTGLPLPRWMRVANRAATFWSWLFLGYATLALIGGVARRSLVGVLIGVVLLMLASLRLATRK
jgi:hypothetical protein